MREGLVKNWQNNCGGLCELAEIEEAIAGFAFPRFDVATAAEIVADLKNAPIYPVLFGGGLTKPRPTDRPPPDEIAQQELPYVGRLVEAYDEHCKHTVETADEALVHEEYGPHLRTSRRDFYCAESLREFSKDVLVDPDDFESLQEQVYDGIKYTVARDYASGYDRVLVVCEQATSVQVGDHPLSSELKPADRSGICHQLANDGRVAWKRP